MERKKKKKSEKRAGDWVWVGVSSEQNQHPNEGNRLDRKLESSLFPYYLSVWHHFSNSCVRLGFGAYRSLFPSPLLPPRITKAYLGEAPFSLQ